MRARAAFLRVARIARIASQAARQRQAQAHRNAVRGTQGAKTGASQGYPAGERRGDGLEVQNSAAEVKLRAERRMGELLAVMPKQNGGDAARTRFHDETELIAPPTLADYGIERMLSHRCQQVAAVPEGLGTCLESVKRLCGNDPEALDLIDQATQKPVGRPANTSDIIVNHDNSVGRVDKSSVATNSANARPLRPCRPHTRAGAGRRC